MEYKILLHVYLLMKNHMKLHSCLIIIVFLLSFRSVTELSSISIYFCWEFSLPILLC